MFSAGTAAVVRARLGGAIPEMIAVIAREVPYYASRARPDHRQRLADAVTSAVGQFIAHVAHPGQSTQAITAEFRAIGGTVAREGRTLDALQDALRLGAGWPGAGSARPTPGSTGGSSAGSARPSLRTWMSSPRPAPRATRRPVCRPRGTGSGGCSPRSSPTAASRRTRRQPRPAAGWVLPAQVAMVVLGERRQDALLLPPGVLADWTGPEPCLLVPDPDGPGRQAAIDRAERPGLRGRPAAIGPSVPLARAAMSLRWARHALALARAGVIPAGPVRCDQHLSTLLILADEDLAAALCGRRLAPLAQLGPASATGSPRRCWPGCSSAENVAEVAQRIHVHPQTVRYRMRQVHKLFGDQLRDPDRRFELQLALRIRTLSAGRRRKAGHPSDRRRRWPTQGDRNRGGLDLFASAAPRRQAQVTVSLCRPSGVRVVMIWRPVHRQHAPRV